MPSFIDLTGHRYNRLLVLSYAGHDSRGKMNIWKCQCDCGTLALFRGPSIRFGSTKSCGCLRSEAARSRKTDLAGQRFTRLVALKYLGPRTGQNGTKAQWLCQCDCGAQPIVDAPQLTSGKTKSCGCFNLDRLNATRTTDVQKRESQRERNHTRRTRERGLPNTFKLHHKKFMMEY